MQNQNPNVPQMHQVPIKEALDVARGKDEQYEVLQRNKFYMPKKSSALCTLEYIRGVTMNKYWVPKTSEVRIANCPQPPTMSVLVDKLLNIAEQ